MDRPIATIGLPIATGAGRGGCQMGPEAFRTAGIVEDIVALGYDVVDWGDVTAEIGPDLPQVAAARNLEATVAWTVAIQEAAAEVFASGAFPVFMGGDHSLSAGTLTAAATRAAAEGRPLFVLWLDSHPDFHTLQTTATGNLHGTPMAYATGQPGFDHFPQVVHPVDPGRVMMMGLRSVDRAERQTLNRLGVEVYDMRRIDEEGIVAPLRNFLDRIRDEDGLLHVSLDVDFLDPTIAPAVGTTVPGGATFREAHLILEMVHSSGLAASLDLAELNPYLDHAGQTARLMVDLTTSLLGKSVMDRPT